MIVKILSSASSDFHGVQYNDKKVEKGNGELMMMKNFPSFINEGSRRLDVRDYLKAVSKNEKIKKPQFHAVISTKFQKHTKEELTEVAESLMQEMGYGEQPFLVVFHNDTENNHVHIVSTRVDKLSGKKINDSYEKLKSQKALSNVMEKLFGINEEEKLNNLLTYHISSLQHLETLLNRNGFKLSNNTNDENSFTILKNGVVQQALSGKQIVFNTPKSESRKKQIRAILGKYKNTCSNKVFKVEDRRSQDGMLPETGQESKDQIVPKVEFESELQKKLKDTFGIDVVFHHKDGKIPFGYTLIDNNTGTVYKGSEILKMSELFEFTSETMDKRVFESLKDFNISDKETKQILLKHLKDQDPENTPKDFMLFETKRQKNKQTFITVKNDVKQYIKTRNSSGVKIMAFETGKFYAFQEKLHYVGELKNLIGENEYQKFMNPELPTLKQTESKAGKELDNAINEMFFELLKSPGTAADPAEDELKKRRKKRR